MGPEIREHLHIVRRIALQVRRRVPSSVQLDDLISAGNEGLLDAARRFDASRGVEFGAYAEMRVRGAVLDELRRHDFVPRSLRRRQRELERAREQAAEAGTSTSDAAVCKRLGLQPEALAGWLEEGAVQRVSEEHADAVEDAAPKADELLVDRERFIPLQRAVATLPERLQLVLSLYYVEEVTLKEIGAMLGVTESRVCQLHAEALKRMRATLSEAPMLQAA